MVGLSCEVRRADHRRVERREARLCVLLGPKRAPGSLLRNRGVGRERKGGATSESTASLTILPPKEEACRQLQLNLQAPPPAAMPKPDYRPNCRCPVNNYRVVVRGRPERRAPGPAGGKEHRMHLFVTLLLPHNSNTKNDWVGRVETSI